jgi:hypothetical protein
MNIIIIIIHRVAYYIYYDVGMYMYIIHKENNITSDAVAATVEAAAVAAAWPEKDCCRVIPIFGVKAPIYII